MLCFDLHKLQCSYFHICFAYSLGQAVYDDINIDQPLTLTQWLQMTSQRKSVSQIYRVINKLLLFNIQKEEIFWTVLEACN